MKRLEIRIDGFSEAPIQILLHPAAPAFLLDMCAFPSGLAVLQRCVIFRKLHEELLLSVFFLFYREKGGFIQRFVSYISQMEWKW